MNGSTMFRALRALRARLALLAVDESGMSTVEYAIGTIAAAAFGAILYTVVTGDSIVAALTNIIGRALNTKV
jgi:Protein of unknown function (DUF4244)